MAWQKGPLPANTWNWGGVVPVDAVHKLNGGFFFADFHGDHVIMFGPGLSDKNRLEAHEVAWWNNSLDLPPTWRMDQVGLAPEHPTEGPV